jgi:AraC family transcriptional regulator of adaptative response/methylated-DNA-[protein]-cysteine methyltransferase
MRDYERIADVITFLTENFRNQPDLEKLSSVAGLSPFHFQRMFKEWAGVSPKKFLQFISLEHAKKLLSMKISVSEASFKLGLSGTSRLHDLFIKIEGMTPGEYKNGGKALNISWEEYDSPFGNVIIGSTSIGICYMAFTDIGDSGFQELLKKFPSAKYQKENHPFHDAAMAVFNNSPKDSIPT